MIWYGRSQFVSDGWTAELASLGEVKRLLGGA